MHDACRLFSSQHLDCNGAINQVCNLIEVSHQYLTQHYLNCPMQASHGSIRLVDVSSEIPNLRRMPGMHAWKVKDTRNHWFSSWEEARATGYK